MKKGTIIVIGIVAFIAIILVWFVTTNNSLVTLEEDIKSSQAEIDNQLKRRADLIPNLVNTVKGLTKQEQEIIDKITDARTKMQSGNTQEGLEANAELTRNINILIENYPQIKSDTAFTSLMDELSGTENRIAVARKGYNDSVSDFNKKIKRFPTNIVASMFNHSEKTYLEISETDKENPSVNF